VRHQGANGRDNWSRPIKAGVKTSPADSRANNRSMTLSELYHRGPLSRADLARATGLTHVSVSQVVAELIAAGLVVERGQAETRGVGKPATLLAVNDSGRAFAAIDLSGADTVAGAVFDLRGNITERMSMRLGGAVDTAAAELVCEFAAALVEAARAPMEGLAVAAPGIVTADGVVRAGAYFGWKNLPLADKLAARTGVPCLVENDARIAALAESARGVDGGLMLVLVAKGLGAGLVLEGDLLRGPSGAAGDIGHVTAVEDGPRCRCGRRGCLETVLSAAVLEGLSRLPPGPGRRAAVESTAHATAAVLAAAIATLDLRRLVFFNRDNLLAPDLLDAIRQSMTARLLPFTTHNLVIRASTAGPDTMLQGAYAHALSERLGITPWASPRP
jgi:predicted NBD/HSP70 family sugar kinase